MGVIQGLEAIQQLTGIGHSLVNKFITFDALNMDIAVLDIFKDPDCILCGKEKK